MVGRRGGRGGVPRLPAGNPVDITGDPHVTVVTVLVVNVAGAVDTAGTAGGVLLGDLWTPTVPSRMFGDGVGVFPVGGMVPRCRGGVLATPWAPPSVARGVSAALRLRTAVPALLMVGAGWAPGLLLFSTVFRGPRDALVLLADGRACVRASVALFATDALARDWLLVMGPARVVVGGVLSGDLLLSPPLPPNVGVSSAESGEGRGGPRIGLDAPLFSRGTLLDLRLLV